MAGIGKVKALQIWCKNRVLGYRDVSVDNMTTSWRDGLAFCALIHKFRPDLIDFKSLSKENVYDNNALAFDVAERCLSVPALLDAEDMVRLRTPDKLSIITYVAQLHNVFKDMEPVGGPAVSVPVKRHQFANRTASSPEPKKKVIFNKENNKISIKEVTDSKVKVSSSVDICEICDGKVYLIEKHMIDGKMYHRSCYKQQNRKIDPTPRKSQISRPKSAFQLTTSSTPVDNRPDWQKNLQKKSDASSSIAGVLDRKIHEDKKNPSTPAQDEVTLRKKTPVPEVRKDTPKTRPVSSAVDMSDGIEKLRMLREQARSQRAGSPSLKERLQKLQNLSEEHKLSSHTGRSSPLRERRASPVRNSIPEVEQEEATPIIQKSASANGTPVKTREKLPNEPLKVTGRLSPKVPNEPPKVTGRLSPKLPNEPPKVTGRLSPKVGPIIEKNPNENSQIHTNTSNNASPITPAASSNPFECEDDEDPHTIEVKISIESPTETREPVTEVVMKGETETLTSNEKVVKDKSTRDEGVGSQSSAVSGVSEIKTPDVKSSAGRKEIKKREIEVENITGIDNLKIEETKDTRSDSVNSTTGESINSSTPQPKARTKRAANLRVQQSAQKTAGKEETTTDNSTPTVKTIPDSSKLNTTITTPKTASNTSSPANSRRSSTSSFASVTIESTCNTTEQTDSVNDPSKSPKPPRPAAAPSVKTDSNKKSTNNSPVQIRDKTRKPTRPTTIAATVGDTAETKTSTLNAPPKPARASAITKSSQNDWEDSLSSWATKRKTTRPPQPQTTWYSTDYPKENNPFGDEEAEESTKLSPDDYDTSLNPFTDEEHTTPNSNMATMTGSTLTNSAPKSLNPFEDDEDELPSNIQKSHAAESKTNPTENELNSVDIKSAASPQQKKKISFNPFESEDSDEETIIKKKSRNRKSPETRLVLPHVPKKKPAPAPPKDNCPYATPKDDYAVPIKASSLHGLNEVTPQLNAFAPNGDAISILSDEPVKRKSKPAPPRPMPPKRRPVSDYGIGADEVTTELKLIEFKQEELERQGRLLEESIRSADAVLASNADSIEEDELMAKWLETINEKNRLVRREAELVFIIKHQDLETKQADIEWQLRQIMHKAENLKTDDEKTEEEKLIHELVTIVTERGNLVDAMDDERMRHAEEDAEINSMMTEKHLTTETEKTTPKSDSKKKKEQAKKEKTPKKKFFGQ